jgi:hypothetical protein
MKDAQGHGSNPRGSREEQIAIRQGIDARHFPTRSPQDLEAAQALGQAHPKSAPVPLGQSFQAAKDALARGRTVALPRGVEGRRQDARTQSFVRAFGKEAGTRIAKTVKP